MSARLGCKLIPREKRPQSAKNNRSSSTAAAAAAASAHVW